MPTLDSLFCFFPQILEQRYVCYADKLLWYSLTFTLFLKTLSELFHFFAFLFLFFTITTNSIFSKYPPYNYDYYSVKIFLRFWMAKITCMTHHNQLLLTKFGRIFPLINRWRQKCSTIAGQCTVNREDLGTRLSCFGCEKKNGRTVGGTFYSFHDELLSKKHSKKTTRRTTSAIWSMFADLNSHLSSKHALSRWT